MNLTLILRIFQVESENFGEKLALLGFRHNFVENSAVLEGWKFCFTCLTLVTILTIFVIKIVRFKAFNMIKNRYFVLF